MRQANNIHVGSLICISSRQSALEIEREAFLGISLCRGRPARGYSADSRGSAGGIRRLQLLGGLPT